MHPDGRAPAHLHPRVRGRQPELDADPEPASTVILDAGYYVRGTPARRHAHDLLADVDSALANVEARADRLLEDLLEFLESETDSAWIDVVE